MEKEKRGRERERWKERIENTYESKRLERDTRSRDRKRGRGNRRRQFSRNEEI